MPRAHATQGFEITSLGGGAGETTGLEPHVTTRTTLGCSARGGGPAEPASPCPLCAGRATSSQLKNNAHLK